MYYNVHTQILRSRARPVAHHSKTRLVPIEHPTEDTSTPPVNKDETQVSAYRGSLYVYLVNGKWCVRLLTLTNTSVFNSTDKIILTGF